MTLSIVPVVVVSRGRSVWAKRPKTISLVLEVLSCMSFTAVQSIKF